MATTDLHRACRPGSDVTTLRTCLERGCAIDEHATDKVAIRGATALILAAYYNLSDAASVLLRHGADLNATDGQGKSALMRAVEQGSRETTAVLLSKGATMSPEYEFIYAAQVGDLLKIRSLIAAGVDINTRDKGVDSTRGGSAVGWASAFGHVSIVEELLCSGTEELKAALTHAIIEKYSEIERILRKELESRC